MKPNFAHFVQVLQGKDAIKDGAVCGYKFHTKSPVYRLEKAPKKRRFKKCPECEKYILNGGVK